MSWIRRACLLPLLALAVLAGCDSGGDHKPPPAQPPQFGAPITKRTVISAQRAAASACPAHEVVHDQVVHEMGDCAPASEKRRAARLRPQAAPRLLQGLTTGPDLSNNNPAYNQQAIRDHGHRFEWLKLSEGTSFTDRTAAAMAANAKRAGLIVGGYHFAHVCLTSAASEGALFVSRLRAVGLDQPGTALPALDVEYGGCSSQSGSRAWIRALRTYVVAHLSGYPNVAVYSGNWWLAPKTGCLFADLPSHDIAWISGYPNASPPCGRSSIDVHQFSDRIFNGANTGDMNKLVHASLADITKGSSSPAATEHAAALCDELLRIRAYIRAHGGHWATHPKRRARADKIKAALAKSKPVSGYPGKWHYVCDEHHDPHCYRLPA